MTTPAGFAPIFKGWNVWRVYAKDSLDFDPLMIGVPDERRLRIFVEEAANSAPGAAVADPLNPLALKGSQVEIIPSTAGLQPALSRETVPGPALLLDGPATLKFVRFYNRGLEGVAAWPHDDDFMLDAVYQPSAENPVTNAEAPPSLAGTADELAKGAGTVIKVVGALAGVGVLIWLVSRLADSRKAIAA